MSNAENKPVINEWHIESYDELVKAWTDSGTKLTFQSFVERESAHIQATKDAQFCSRLKDVMHETMKHSRISEDLRKRLTIILDLI